MIAIEPMDELGAVLQGRIGRLIEIGAGKAYGKLAILDFVEAFAELEVRVFEDRAGGRPDLQVFVEEDPLLVEDVHLVAASNVVYLLRRIFFLDDEEINCVTTFESVFLSQLQLKERLLHGIFR